MIISHDRQTLFIGVPKNGSQTARSVLGQIGVDLVGELGRHPTLPEAIRLAEEQFPGKSISPTAIYAFWRDPVERFCSAVEFHKRCLPNSLMQLFPDRFIGIEPHPRWFETDPGAVAADLRAVIVELPLPYCRLPNTRPGCDSLSISLAEMGLRWRSPRAMQRRAYCPC